MPKYIIVWNAGYGENSEVIEAASQEEAQGAAYEAWREDAENNADYWAKPLTRDLAADYDHDDEFDDAKETGR